MKKNKVQQAAAALSGFADAVNRIPETARQLAEKHGMKPVSEKQHGENRLCARLRCGRAKSPQTSPPPRD